MLIPHHQLSSEALRGLIVDFVTRAGTQVDDPDLSLQARIDAVLAQLQSGRVAIVFDEDSGTCSILPRDQLPPETA